MSAVLALVGIGLAVLAWGTFTAPMKTKSVVSVKLDPVVFQLYMSVGICISSICLLIFRDVTWAWTWWSVLSAGIWVPASLLCVLCVRDLGIALGQALWSGTVALVSFLWGQVYFQDGMKNPLLGTLGIFLLVAGIVAMGVLSGSTADSSPRKPKLSLQGIAEQVDVLPTTTTEAVEPASESRRYNRIRGLCLAVCIGICAGSTLVPLRLAPETPFRDGVHALSFAVCFGISAMAVTLCIFVMYSFWCRRIPDMHLRKCFIPAALSGVLWNVGNAGSTLATLPPLGLTVGYPCTQGCLLVSGMCGIFVYGEVSGAQRIGLFFAAATVVLCGAGLLGVFGAS